MAEEIKCTNCEDRGWVCEGHDNVPWGDRRCCGAPGKPCKLCNNSDGEHDPPRDIKGLRVALDKDGWRH